MSKHASEANFLRILKNTKTQHIHTHTHTHTHNSSSRFVCQSTPVHPLQVFAAESRPDVALQQVAASRHTHTHTYTQTHTHTHTQWNEESELTKQKKNFKFEKKPKRRQQKKSLCHVSSFLGLYLFSSDSCIIFKTFGLISPGAGFIQKTAQQIS